MMQDFRLFALITAGPKSVAVPANTLSIHKLLDIQPVGVYTALRTFQHNKFLLLNQHLRRLEESMARLGWEYELDQQGLRKALHLVCSSYPLADSRIRIDVLSRPSADFGFDARVFIAQGPHIALSESVYSEGVHVGIARHLKRLDPKVKSAEFVIKRRAFLNKRSDLFEALLVDDQGYILEGTSSNFFAILGG